MGEQDVADQRGAFACPEGPVTRVVAGPSCVWLGAAKPTVALDSMSGHGASNAVVTVLLSFIPFFRFLDVRLRFGMTV